MKKIAMTLLATAVAVPMMFAADTPKADPAAPTTKTSKKHKKSKKHDDKKKDDGMKHDDMKKDDSTAK